MIEAILENQETKVREYLYFKNYNNLLLYYGFCISDTGIIPVDKNIIQKIYNLFKINDECVYIEDYLNYQVYLDKKNNIKHYIKNGIEDFIMLFKNNGEDIRIFSIKDGSKKNNTNNKKFRIGKFIISVSLNVMLLLGVYITPPIIQAQLREGNVSNNIQYSFSKIIYSISDYFDLDIKCIDCDDAINLIENSNIPSDLKNVFANQTLLNDIFPYYENTSMEYLIKPKLQNLKLRIYEPTDNYITDPNTTDGFYTDMAPNVLNVKNISKYKEIAKHEFVHLLQEPNHKYIFLHEAVAEIVSEEYLDKLNDVYGFCVLNVSLLMDTIGPKIIWETVFGGDDTNLINILKSNLNEAEFNELLSYLTTPPQETVENCQRINHIISNLYRSINNEEISNNKNIYNNAGYHIKRIYFNEDKMNDTNLYMEYNKIDDEFLHINEIFPDQTVRSHKNLIK